MYVELSYQRTRMHEWMNGWMDAWIRERKTENIHTYLFQEWWRSGEQQMSQRSEQREDEEEEEEEEDEDGEEGTLKRKGHINNFIILYA